MPALVLRRRKHLQKVSVEVGAGLVNRGAVAALVERKCSYSASPSEAHTAVASNCINEFPGDCSRSREGLVKLGFRNPSL